MSNSDSIASSAGVAVEDSDTGDDELPADERSRFTSDLVASLWPWQKGTQTADVEIVVYVVTGNHGGIRIPEQFCRECHRFAHAAEVAADRVDAEVNLRIASWWTHLPFALWHGGYHAPVMVVDGDRLCQGYDVPTAEQIAAAIEEAR
jgi:hypothetical protein